MDDNKNEIRFALPIEVLYEQNGSQHMDRHPIQGGRKADGAIYLSDSCNGGDSFIYLYPHQVKALLAIINGSDEYTIG